MARYVKTPDIWTLDDSERAKLQPGQWVTCGKAAHKSRFYAMRNNGHVVAFHGPNASAKLVQYLGRK
jgi:hypothetical protein